VKIHEINEVERLRGALKKVSDLIETNQGCSPNNHTIAVLVMDALRPK
jgi:hypothetical protein